MSARPLRLAFIGTRGVPAQYGGFETAVEEIGRRLAARGHHVVVYRRAAEGETSSPSAHLGMELRTLPALRSKALETLSHTMLSAVHHRFNRPAEVVFLFNAANAVLLPIVRLRSRTPVAVHVDGLEWQRSKWGRTGRWWYRMSESLAVRWADALIADAPGIAAYYAQTFGASTEQIAYGAPILERAGTDRIAALGLEPGRYHLVVARFEPENNVALIVEGYRASRAQLPLVVVGGAPYSAEYTQAVRAAAEGDERIRLIGPVWDQDQLDELYAHALLYLHGHRVGGTNPSLLRAMGAATAVAAFDVRFNREVAGDHAWTFATSGELASIVERAEADPADCAARGQALQRRAAASYRWDDVATAYEALARALLAGQTRRGEVSGRRRTLTARSTSGGTTS